MMSLARVSFSLLLVATSSGALAAAPNYSMTLLGGGYAAAINDAGVVAGANLVADDYYHATLFKGGRTDLGTLAGAAAFSYATGLNNHGQAVGWSDSLGQKSAFVYRNGSLQALGGANFFANTAKGINDGGQIVGAATFGNAGGPQHAFSYRDGVATDLGTLGADYSVANGVNSAGRVVGTVSTYRQGGSVTERAFVYDNGNMSALRILGSDVSVANAVNDAGNIVGKYTAGDASEHAYLYVNGSATDLGTIGGAFSEALGVNDAGSVVGVASTADGGQLHAFLYAGNQMLDLNALVLQNYGFTVRGAYSINEKGQIAAYGCKLMDCQAILLDPLTAVPEPASYAMLLAGLGLVGLARRRFQPRRAVPALNGAA
ncbi:PEP-CTERM sorting domain-containing protein [Rugamonas sp. DEMB1]|uniref:PEP-CTERM sorting domain-containing protein n=1 Tax=Rugamonas sp. DEMB1 TaxID=3039386 RepID=UPI00244A70A3|nr:PEP-CTERM sorting domain-containing protein [Rugamonas sp. DEMB1]WGG49152.1 PEP-CTERM sorting domain-containing protein [Rugamonas sp. DEMB1]